jgi:excinuclease ABC subunit A
VLENLRALGFMRVLANGDLLDLDDPVMDDAATATVDLAAAGELLIVADRLILRDDMRERVADSLGTAFHEGDGEVIVVTLPDHERLLFS